MKKLYFIPSIVSILISLSMFGQDTIYYDAERKETIFPANALNYTITSTSELPKGVEAVIRRCDISGQILSETFYRNLKKKEITGQRTSWTKEGIKRMEASYEKGKYHGNFFTYWPNGEIKRRDYYQKGKFKNGTVWDIEGNEIEYFPFKVDAKFPGGQSEMQNYLRNNSNAPENIRGRVVVQLKIDKSGKVSVGKITGDNLNLKMEAFRLVSTMPDWEPAIIDGNVEQVSYTLPIVFGSR